MAFYLLYPFENEIIVPGLDSSCLNTAANVKSEFFFNKSAARR